MPWGTIGYAVLCVVVPAAWGLAIYACSGLIETRLRRGRPSRPDGSGSPDDSVLPLEYHI